VSRTMRDKNGKEFAVGSKLGHEESPSSAELEVEVIDGPQDNPVATCRWLGPLMLDENRKPMTHVRISQALFPKVAWVVCT